MQLEVDRGDHRRTRLVEEAAPPDPPADGQVVLALERFALTANNVTYALAGDLLDYWGFFPAESPWGRIPVMGIGRVVASACDGVAVDERHFGFFPMAEHHVVAARPSSAGFVDTAEHRSGHAPAYRSFERQPAVDDQDRADRALLVRGLFVTSFLVDDHLAEEADFGADRVLVTSASSKTSIALAHALHRRGVRAVGLTSTRNAGFVGDLGLYDEVVLYDALEALDPGTPSVVVDMAGSADVLGRVHRHLGDGLRASIGVGMTHWEEGGRTDDLPGPAPAFFFAPTQMVKRSQEWGREAFDERVSGALGAFVDDAARWLDVHRAAGPEAVAQAWADTVEGRVPPDRGLVLSMAPGGLPG